MSMTSYFQSSGHYENEWHEDIDTTECDWCGDIAPADEWFEEIGKRQTHLSFLQRQPRILNQKQLT
jgi:hypothetical protein